MLVPIKDGSGAVFAHELVCVSAARMHGAAAWCSAPEAVSRDVLNLRAAAALTTTGLRGHVLVSLSVDGVTAGAEETREGLRKLAEVVDGLIVQAPWEAAAELDTHAMLTFTTWCKSSGIGVADVGLGDSAQQRAVWAAVNPDIVRIHSEVLVLHCNQGHALEGIKHPGARLLVGGIDNESAAALAVQHGADLFQGIVVGRPKRVAVAAPTPGRRSPAACATGIYAVAAASALALAACSSPPKPAMPDGRDRVEVNDPARLAAYQRYSMNETQRLAEQRALQDETSALRRQVEQLQGLMKIMIALPQGQGGAATPAPAPGVMPQSVKPAAQAVEREASGRTVSGGIPTQDYTREDTPNGEIFRVFHNFGASAFSPDEVTERQLVEAARAGSLIEIHGRTDSAVIDPANQRIALARAVAARAWLVERGVSPSKIRTRYQSAGSFLANNSSDEGRALNRRVEISIHRSANAAVAPQGAKS